MCRNKILVLEIEFQAESKNEQLQIYYKVCYARVLDYRRKFIEAAQRYNELSYRGIIHEDERMTALRNALICTVLASAGMWMSILLVYGAVAYLLLFSQKKKRESFGGT